MTRERYEKEVNAIFIQRDHLRKKIIQTNDVLEMIGWLTELLYLKKKAYLESSYE